MERRREERQSAAEPRPALVSSHRGRCSKNLFIEIYFQYKLRSTFKNPRIVLVNHVDTNTQEVLVDKISYSFPQTWF